MGRSAFIHSGCCRYQWLSLVLCVQLLSLVHARELPIRVSTKHGVVSGVSHATYDAFLGVPYARPPIGHLRWRFPQPLGSWYPEILRADTQPPGCIQSCVELDFACPVETSEDCLYLNIFRPPSPPSEGLLPVFVFLHGGEFRTGGCSATLYNGEYLAPAIDAIVVCVNYRLGAMGFLYLGTDPDTGEEITGNFGLGDQLAALEFLKENLRSFGGDPDQITLAGQSAGAESVGIHLTSPEADHLFQKAILYSDPMALPLLEPGDATRLGEHFAASLSCENDTVRCLRAKSANDIRVATEGSLIFVPNESKLFEQFQPWGPVVEMQPIASFEAGRYKERPIMMSTTSDEGRAYAFSLFEKPLPDFLYMMALSMLIPDISEEILTAYPADPDDQDQREVVSRIATEYVFTCPVEHVAKLMFAQRGVDVYHYIVDQVFSNPEGWGDFTECYDYVCHGVDLPYIFGSVGELYSYTAAEEDMMRHYWGYLSNFVRTGDPNSDGDSEFLTYWPSIGEEDGVWSTLVLSADDDIRVEFNWKADECRFWDEIGYHDVPNLNK